MEYLQEARAHFITTCFLQAGVEPAGTTQVAGVEPAGTTHQAENARGATVMRKLAVDFLRPIFDDSGPLSIEVSIVRIGRTSFGVGHRESRCVGRAVRGGRSGDGGVRSGVSVAAASYRWRTRGAR
ncbi:MAG: hotdog domain-containing protein [Rhodococcus sp. (in: high G+C Gram-positive bacteria)]